MSNKQNKLIVFQGKEIRKRYEELGFYIGINYPQVEMQTKTGKKEKLELEE